MIPNNLLWVCQRVGLAGTAGTYTGDQTGSIVDRSAIQWLELQLNSTGTPLTHIGHGRIYDVAGPLFLRGGVGFVLPAATQGFVHGDERGGATRLTDGELVLRFEQNPLGVQHRKKVGRAVFVALPGEGRGGLARLL